MCVIHEGAGQEKEECAALKLSSELSCLQHSVTYTDDGACGLKGESSTYITQQTPTRSFVSLPRYHKVTLVLPSSGGNPLCSPPSCDHHNARKKLFNTPTVHTQTLDEASVGFHTAEEFPRC